MKPMIILPLGCMSKENLKILNDNGICVVEAKDPSKVKFVDPIPSISSRTDIERAAIQLSRKIMTHPDNGGFDYKNGIQRSDIVKLYLDFLMKGTALDIKEERNEQYYDSVKRKELERLAREDARAEHAAKRAAKKKLAHNGAATSPKAGAPAAAGSSRAAATE